MIFLLLMNSCLDSVLTLGELSVGDATTAILYVLLVGADGDLITVDA